MLHDGVRRGYAEAIAALLRLRTVGVEDADAHCGGVERKEPVGAQAVMTAAEDWEQVDQRVKRAGQVQDKVIVAQCLVLDEIDSH
jgi:hypothetical protein